MGWLRAGDGAPLGARPRLLNLLRLRVCLPFLGLLLVGCKNPAEPDLDTCIAAEARKDWTTAIDACERALQASPKSDAGQLARGKLGLLREKMQAQKVWEAASQSAHEESGRKAEAVRMAAASLGARPALQGSRAAFRNWFTRLAGLQFTAAELADGTPREMAQAGMLILETIGYGDALERTSLTFGIVKDDMESVMTATSAVIVFMRETGWEKGRSWVTSTMQKPKGGSITKNGVHYQVILMMPGMFNLSAKPASKAD